MKFSYFLTAMKRILIIALIIMWSHYANAQYYEDILMDSLQRIVNYSDTKDADRVDYFSQISRIYVSKGDSVSARQTLDRARMIAKRQEDGKYMIYVYNQELRNCLNNYSEKITFAYKIMDSVYMIIKKTSDIGMKAIGYSAIGKIKFAINPEYDFDDSYKALSLAEKLPEKSTKKYEIIGDVYYTMFVRYLQADKETAEEYLDLMQQTAGKWGDKSFSCWVMSLKLEFFALYSRDKDSLTKQFLTLENFISENTNKIQPYDYAQAVGALVTIYPYISNPQYLKKIDAHIETFRKMTGDSPEYKSNILYIETAYALMQKNYANAINYASQRIEVNKSISPLYVYNDYKNLAIVYAKAGQFKQAYDALDSCFYYQQQYQRSKSIEQHQLAEVKFGVEKEELLIKHQRSQIIIISITTVLVIIIFTLLILSLNRRKKIDRLEKEKALLIAQQTEEKNERIEKRLILNATELNRKTLLIEKAKDMEKEQFNKAIRNEMKKSKLTNDHIKLFQDIDSQFYKRLQDHAHPNNLSNKDMKYLAYILLRMNNKEIADVMNVGYRTVISQKYRLKKKLHLAENEDLDKFIVNLPPPRINIY